MGCSQRDFIRSEKIELKKIDLIQFTSRLPDTSDMRET